MQVNTSFVTGIHIGRLILRVSTSEAEVHLQDGPLNLEFIGALTFSGSEPAGGGRVHLILEIGALCGGHLLSGKNN